MKKIIFMLALVIDMAYFSQALGAEVIVSGGPDTDNECGDNCFWNLNTQTGALVISGSGAMKRFSAGDAPWDTWGSQIKTVTIKDGITSISQFAFYSTNVVSVDLASSITSIGRNAFQGGRMLKEINLPEGIETIPSGAFSRTNNLTSIVIPDSVTTIGSDAFSKDPSCQNSIHIFMGDTVTSVSDSAFKLMENFTIYCTGDVDTCRSNVGVAFADKVKAARAKKINGVTYIYDIKGKLITTSGKRIEKRIYTIDEANEVTGSKNRISIRYR